MKCIQVAGLPAETYSEVAAGILYAPSEVIQALWNLLKPMGQQKSAELCSETSQGQHQMKATHE